MSEKATVRNITDVWYGVVGTKLFQFELANISSINASQIMKLFKR